MFLSSSFFPDSTSCFVMFSSASLSDTFLCLCRPILKVCCWKQKPIGGREDHKLKSHLMLGKLLVDEQSIRPNKMEENRGTWHQSGESDQWLKSVHWLLGQPDWHRAKVESLWSLGYSPILATSKTKTWVFWKLPITC